MSAYLVDPEHINVLVYKAMQPAGHMGLLTWNVSDETERFGYAHRSASVMGADAIGQMLLDQNAASVNHRYSEDEAYVYSYQRPKHTEWLPVDILGAISCYEYQACETPDYRDSEAYAFCRALESRMIHQLPGHESAPWEITASSVPAHVRTAIEKAAERRAESELVQTERVATANAVLDQRVAAGQSGPMTRAEHTAIESGGRVIAFPSPSMPAPDPATRVELPAPPVVTTSSDRDVAIKAIRKALRRRSGKAWSVRGGRGTSWGWITISAPPARSGKWGEMSDDDAAELGQLLGLGRSAHVQGVSVPSSLEYRREYTARAEGREPDKIAEPYWD